VAAGGCEATMGALCRYGVVLFCSGGIMVVVGG